MLLDFGLSFYLSYYLFLLFLALLISVERAFSIFNNNPFVPESSVPNILMVALALRRISALMSERVFAPLAVISSKSVSTNFSRSFADSPSSHDVMAS